MQITKELIENDIRGMETQLENLKASVAQTTGALSVLKNILAFLDKPEPTPDEPKEDISAANKTVQAEVEARMAAKVHPDAEPALTETELAEIVAGAGAVVEEIVPIPEPLPAKRKRVNVYGKYEKEQVNV